MFHLASLHLVRRKDVGEVNVASWVLLYDCAVLPYGDHQRWDHYGPIAEVDLYCSFIIAYFGHYANLAIEGKASAVAIQVVRVGCVDYLAPHLHTYGLHVLACDLVAWQLHEWCGAVPKHRLDHQV